MSLSVITCLEIYTNPKDLEINIVKDTETQKYAFLVCRGPGHNYKAMLTTLPFTSDFDNAIEAVQIILEGALEVGRTFNLDDDMPEAKTLKSFADKIETAEVLNLDIMEKIISELREKTTVCTHKFLEDYVWVN